jgi:hypothetical protein
MRNELNMKEIYKDENIIIELDDKTKFIYVEWQRHVSGNDFRTLFALATSIAIEEKCLYWLSEASPVHFIDFADQNWMLREMAPLLLNSNLIKFARVSNKESASLLDIHRIHSELRMMNNSNPLVELEIFLDKEQAMTWLFFDFD